MSSTIETWALSSTTLLAAALLVDTATMSYSSCLGFKNLKKIEAIEIDAFNRAAWNVSTNKTSSEVVVNATLTLAKP